MCENEKKKYHSIEMTTGSLWKNILLFSLPLMGSQVLEVLFNLSDVAVVGRFADYMALGAVGSTTLLVTLFTGILIGMGAGVIKKAQKKQSILLFFCAQSQVCSSAPYVFCFPGGCCP